MHEDGDLPVYLDYAATSPLCEEAARAMAAYCEPGLANIAVNANANSLHTPGRAAFQALERARRELADCLHARPDELVFTCGATESANAAVIGMAHAQVQKRRMSGEALRTPRVIVTAIEHHAVLNPVDRLRREGFEVVRLKPRRSGIVDPASLEDALAPDTVLVSVQHANSEMGAVQPICELAALARSHGVPFHTDATQALGKVPVDLASAGVDAASFSAHKVGGPKGIGLLYLKARTPFSAQMLGGGQESGRRSGTQNVAGAVGFAAAARAAVKSRADEAQRLMALRDRLYRELAVFPDVVRTVAVEPGSRQYLPNIVHLMVRGMESETLVLRLDNAGICVSGGSACSAGSLDPSHVLAALDIRSDLALGALRVSLGRYTRECDIDRFLQAFAASIR